jgi:hypothetical protein
MTKLSTVIGCVAIAVLLVGTCCPPACAQVSAPTVLEIDIENVVEYQTDVLDLSRTATSPGVTPSAGIMRWAPAMVVGDIVAVNGEPVKGTLVGRPWAIGLSPTPAAGEAIADTTRISVGFRTFEILKTDSTPIGTIIVAGLNGGTDPSGPEFRDPEPRDCRRYRCVPWRARSARRQTDSGLHNPTACRVHR